MDEFEKKIKQYVFWLGLVAILGGNSGNLFDILYPNKVRDLNISKVEKNLKEYVDDHLEELQILCRYETDVKVREMKDQIVEKDAIEMNKLRRQVAVNETKIDSCLRRTMQ